MDPGDGHPDAASVELPERCAYCGAPLEDLGLAFILHVNDSEDCHAQWQAFRGNMERESGGS